MGIVTRQRNFFKKYSTIDMKQEWQFISQNSCSVELIVYFMVMWKIHTS